MLWPLRLRSARTGPALFGRSDDAEDEDEEAPPERIAVLRLIAAFEARVRAWRRTTLLAASFLDRPAADEEAGRLRGRAAGGEDEEDAVVAVVFPPRRAPPLVEALFGRGWRGWDLREERSGESAQVGCAI